MKRLACLAILAATLLPAAELRIIDSAMYGRLAVMSEGPVRLDVALTEGARIVSWQIDGKEIGFVGRIWGGDLYDQYRVGETSGNTRFQPPASVEVLRAGEAVAIRARFEVADGVFLRRVFVLNPQGFFLEAEFEGTDRAWYEFDPHLIRPKTEPSPEIRCERDGWQKLPLKPKEEYGELPRALALTGLAEPAIALALGPGVSLHPRVWGSSMCLGIGGTWQDQPLRATCWLAREDGLEQALASPPAFPALTGAWEPVDYRLPEPKRPPTPEIARRYGPYGACNSRPDYMAPLAASGLRWVRVGGFSWATCEVEPGTRDYATAEASLAAAEREGLAVIGEMSGNPGWATTDGNRRSPPKDWAAWERHVEQVVAHFRDRVHVWEIWNEPDINQFWAGSAEEYVQLLKHAYRGAKRADPACLVMSAGLDGSGEKFLAKILDLGAGDSCDLVGAHPYAGGTAIAAHRMRTMRRILAFHKLNKPLWITEVGWQSGGWKAGPGVVDSEETKAARLTESYPILTQQADVVCWYIGVEPGKMYGLLQPTGKTGFVLNPAWFAMRELALPKTPDIQIEAPRTATIQAGKAQTLAATVRSDRPVQARWLGAEPGWGEPEPVRIPAGGSNRVALPLQPPAYIRPETRHLILAVQDLEGRHLANQVVELRVENPGKVCDFSLGGSWIKLIDRAGKETGPWKPAHSLCSEPGEGFLQPLRPKNLGNFDDTLALQVTGTAAPWLADLPKTIAVPAGKTGWTSLRVRVPADAKPGTYTLVVQAHSRTFPEVKAEWRGSYSVVAPKPRD
jgi:hypothetical protein